MEAGLRHTCYPGVAKDCLLLRRRFGQFALISLSAKSNNGSQDFGNRAGRTYKHPDLQCNDPFRKCERSDRNHRDMNMVNPLW